MDKYIFLDIDGVIATPETIEEVGWGLTKSKQELLGKILFETGAKIVLSSSWRSNDLGSTIDHMRKKGFLFCDKLIGVTKRLYKYIDREQKIHLSIPRGLEIDQWIDTHVHSNNGKDWNRKKIGVDFTYVIIDNDSDMLLEQKDYFIHTNKMIGLTEIEAERAVAILNFKPDLTDEPLQECIIKAKTKQAIFSYLAKNHNVLLLESDFIEMENLIRSQKK